MWTKKVFGTGGLLYMRNEERSEIIQDALEFLDDEMIEDVEKLRGCASKESIERSSNTENTNIFMGKSLWRKGIALVASICVLITGGWIYETYIYSAENNEEIPNMETDNITPNQSQRNEEITDDAEESLNQQNSTSNEIGFPESAVDDLGDQAVGEEMKDAANLEYQRDGVYIPRMKVFWDKTEGIEEDMLGFFILNGRSYIQYEFQTDYKEKNADFVGDYVGHITGMIDEWTEPDGYVEGAGTYTGNVYEVKGVSPEFMLCMVWENSWVETFINHNDITLYKGADLVDDWLDLRGNYDAIAFETIIDNQFAYESLELSEEELEVFDQFLDAFAEADYVYVEEIVEHPFGGDWDTADMMDFYYVKENGVRLRFRTMGDGYVKFPWIDACVKIDQNVYDAVVEILLKHAQ